MTLSIPKNPLEDFSDGVIAILITTVLLISGAAAAHADECGPNTVPQSVTGKLEFHAEDYDVAGTPFSLRGNGLHRLMPDGSFFGMAQGTPGYARNAETRLSPFVGRQVTVTGCTGFTEDFTFIERISSVLNRTPSQRDTLNRE